MCMFLQFMRKRYVEDFICAHLVHIAWTKVSAQDAKPLGQYSNSVILQIVEPPYGVAMSKITTWV